MVWETSIWLFKENNRIKADSFIKAANNRATSTISAIENNLNGLQLTKFFFVALIVLGLDIKLSFFALTRQIALGRDDFSKLLDFR